MIQKLKYGGMNGQYLILNRTLAIQTLAFNSCVVSCIAASWAVVGT
jgi:hypothetical protein